MGVVRVQRGCKEVLEELAVVDVSLKGVKISSNTLIYLTVFNEKVAASPPPPPTREKMKSSWTVSVEEKKYKGKKLKTSINLLSPRATAIAVRCGCLGLMCVTGQSEEPLARFFLCFGTDAV
ncbi:hypothetical protein J6590_034124 [Homalodisca vitripennis]|nr:hypothetical protein J6590_034124 [Homalodisca vitripennis]